MTRLLSLSALLPLLVRSHQLPILVQQYRRNNLRSLRLARVLLLLQLLVDLHDYHQQLLDLAYAAHQLHHLHRLYRSSQNLPQHLNRVLHRHYFRLDQVHDVHILEHVLLKHVRHRLLVLLLLLVVMQK